jgi:lysophospholipase L1-like esterase
MRRDLLRWAGVVAAIVLAVGLLTGVGTAGYAEADAGVRVMPLGDSITDGITVPGAYRIGLWQRFAHEGYAVDFVGSLSNGPATLGDHDHEGHSGWRIDQIDANIAGWLRTYTPHTVLLHIGTNDVLQNHDVAGAPARLSGLIDHIVAAVPAAEVFVATIIPIANSGQEADARGFNAAVPGIVQSKAGAGEHVHLVDMHAALTTADLADGVHPNATGYDKMAAAWYSALKSVPGSIGDPGGSTNTPGEIHAVGAAKCLDVPNATQNNGTQLQISDCNGGPGQIWASSGGRLTVYGGVKCLDAYDNQTTAGTKVEIWDCNGGANQQWRINADGTITGVQSGLCLDVTGARTSNGTPVELWTCNGGGNQKWSLT